MQGGDKLTCEEARTDQGGGADGPYVKRQFSPCLWRGVGWWMHRSRHPVLLRGVGRSGGTLREGCGGPPEGRVAPEARRSESEPRRRLLQKCAKALLYPFAMPLTGILECLGREFCNNLRSSPTPSAARGHAQKMNPNASQFHKGLLRYLLGFRLTDSGYLAGASPIGDAPRP